MSIAEISKEIDTVVISHNELKAIMMWNKFNKPNVAELVDKAFFPFQTFVCKVEARKGDYDPILIELDSYKFLKGGRFTSDAYMFTYKRGEKNDGWDFEGHVWSAPLSEWKQKETFELVHNIVMKIFIYISQKSRERIIKVSPQVTRKERENYEYKPRECFLLNDIVKYVSIHPNKSSIKSRCECWGVRGHIRHYQDGKTVFIKPYKKGTKRDILEPKSRTYLLTNE